MNIKDYFDRCLFEDKEDVFMDAKLHMIKSFQIQQRGRLLKVC